MYNVLAISLLVVCHAVKVQVRVNSSSAIEFQSFMVQYGHNYAPDTEEFRLRAERFHANLAEVRLQNSKPNRLWTAAINHLADRTVEEMKAFNGWKGGVSRSNPVAVGSLLEKSSKGKNPEVERSIDDLPDDKSYLDLWTAQKDQIHSQTCGNCWAAATASLLEAHAQIHMEQERHFSFEELTTCTENPFDCGGDGGCGGATSELALQEVMVNGIGDEEGHAEKCAGTRHIVNSKETGNHEMKDGVRLAKPDAVGRKLGMVGWERLPSNKYEPVLRALVERGPVAVAVSTDWQNYGSGIFDGCSIDATIGHAVLAMGYGVDKERDNTKYWIIQNSWGKSFGENGHVRLKRLDNEEKHCGQDKQPELGTTCDDGKLSPTSVEVCGMCGILYDVTVPYFEGPGKP